MMTDITDYVHRQIAQFDNACQTAKPSMVAYLADYFAKIDRSQVDTLWVEYNDDLDLFIFWLDKTGKTLNRGLAGMIPKEHYPTGNFSLDEIEDELYDFDLDDDEVMEYYDDISDNIHNRFETWFIDCWKQANQNNAQPLPAYFSEHDSITKYDLVNHTKKALNDLEKKHGWTCLFE
ncbi:hypothetical protein [Moraxella lacunata]|uniref:hypothetical protein n=1 Tax=Moraxella lacunata TaxID=477 RepID=UPI003EE23193